MWQKTLASTLAELDRCLQLLEDKFLKDQDFLAGAGCQVFQSRPKLAAWCQHVEAAVGEDLFQEAIAAVTKAKDLPPADSAVKEKLKPLVQGGACRATDGLVYELPCREKSPRLDPGPPGAAETLLSYVYS
ncbi:hypothetical protein MC885_011113 [Smutsia gigantea]|nr:hypothetical protein MC885_011113 [Smutsia gigantea]